MMGIKRAQNNFESFQSLKYYSITNLYQFSQNILEADSICNKKNPPDPAHPFEIGWTFTIGSAAQEKIGWTFPIGSAEHVKIGWTFPIGPAAQVKHILTVCKLSLLHK